MSEAFRYPTNPAGKIKSIRVIYDNGDWWEHSATAEVPAKVRLHVARALVADMPGVVVAKVPERRPDNDYLTYDGGKDDGWNHCISATLTAGSATDD